MLSNFLLGTFNAATNLPQLLDGKCSAATCTTLTSDLDVIKACFTDPTDTAKCRGYILFY